MKEGKRIIRECLDNGLLLYEGEYSDGEKNEIGKQYNSRGQLVFEG